MKKIRLMLLLIFGLGLLMSCSKNAYCPSYSSGTYNSHYKSTLPHYQNRK